MSFKNNGYVIIKNIIPEYMASFLFQYMKIKEQVKNTLIKNKKIYKWDTKWGGSDQQVPGAFSMYGDAAFDTLLQYIKPIMEKYTDLKLREMYSYCRIYKKGNILHYHKDRGACEFSVTLNLGGDNWPFDIIDKDENKTTVTMKPGDGVIYRGCDLEHGRTPFKGKECVQVFLHYNKADDNKSPLLDGRPHLGIPYKC